MTFMLKKQAFACALLSLAAAGGALAADLPPLAAAQPDLSPEQRAAIVRAYAAAATTRGHHASAAGTTPGGKLDNTPPVLKSFRITPPADVAAPFAQLVFDAKATDDLSGVAAVQFGLQGPHGQGVGGYSWITVPQKSATVRFALNETAYVEPGTWTVTYVYVGDAAGNYVFYAGDELAALGNVQVTIANGQPGLVDFTPPVVSQGTVVTPSLSASGTQKGTTQSPLIKADFALSDDRSGVMQAAATWCLADMSACLYSFASESVHGQRKETLHMAGSLPSAQTPGVYILHDLQAWDQAGNLVWMDSADFGGETDFSTLMPGGHTITVTP
jgi:hypothetical protein